MLPTELRQLIIKKINLISDNQVLEEIYRLLEHESKITTTYSLSDEEKLAIDQGLQDIKAGKLYSSEEADELLEKWLKK